MFERRQRNDLHVSSKGYHPNPIGGPGGIDEAFRGFAYQAQFVCRRSGEVQKENQVERGFSRGKEGNFLRGAVFKNGELVLLKSRPCLRQFAPKDADTEVNEVGIDADSVDGILREVLRLQR